MNDQFKIARPEWIESDEQFKQYVASEVVNRASYFIQLEQSIKNHFAKHGVLIAFNATPTGACPVMEKGGTKQKVLATIDEAIAYAFELLDSAKHQGLLEAVERASNDQR